MENPQLFVRNQSAFVFLSYTAPSQESWDQRLIMYFDTQYELRDFADLGST